MYLSAWAVKKRQLAGARGKKARFDREPIPELTQQILSMATTPTVPRPLGSLEEFLWLIDQNRPASQSVSLFDFLAGTSSGGMLVLGLTCSDAFGCRRPLCSATEVTELFYEWGHRAFANNHRKQVGRSGRLVPETALKTYFATSFAMPC